MRKLGLTWTASSVRPTIRIPFLRIVSGTIAATEYGLLPPGAKERVPGQQRRQQQRDARSDAAALVGDFNRDRRQREHKALAVVRRPGQREQRVDHLGRSLFQEPYRPAQ